MERPLRVLAPDPSWDGDDTRICYFIYTCNRKRLSGVLEFEYSKCCTALFLSFVVIVVVDVLEGGVRLSQINLAQGIKLATARGACTGHYGASPGTNLHNQRAERQKINGRPAQRRKNCRQWITILFVFYHVRRPLGSPTVIVRGKRLHLYKSG